ncbi:P-loop containing nucleoside triphosphate hydrolase protein [Mycena galopus ATCC 62051]|nr:P-loop containing nucleoside triphosphate hydrolase protein [Mycena galopus ATCC 62051]
MIHSVMGMGKSGKSTFINLATRSENLRVGLSANSCTGAVEAATPLDLDGRQVVLLDTPGFDHTHKSDAEVLRNIAFELETKYRQGIKLHGIIYLYRISDVRVSNAAKQDFLGLRRLCGDRSMRNVVILTNMWDRVNAEDGRRRAGNLQFLDNLFRPALEDGARFMHHTDGTGEFVRAIIRSMIRNQPEALAIQEELVDKDMDIDQTSVGKEVDRWMAERIEGYEEQEDELWDSAEQARRDSDEKTRSGLLAELQNVRAKTAKLEKERAGQVRDYKCHRQLNQTPAGTP